MKSHSPGANERLVDTESGHPEAIWRSAGTDPTRTFDGLLQVGMAQRVVVT